ncbi:MAG: hypothetical protein R3C56_32150 [Pirellulaceae bacterium]
MSGPSSLVRGMFVEVVIEAKPATPLLLVPKLSVKPATGSNQIWKFTANPQALVQTRQRLKAAGTLADPDREPVQGVDASAQSPTLDDPDAWQAGFLSVIDGVAVVGPYLGPAPLEDKPAESPSTGADSKAEPIEYWVCEVASSELVAGDKVVVTPLPGVEAEGDEPIRVRKSQLE